MRSAGEVVEIDGTLIAQSQQHRIGLRCARSNRHRSGVGPRHGGRPDGDVGGLGGLEGSDVEGYASSANRDKGIEVHLSGPASGQWRVIQARIKNSQGPGGLENPLNTGLHSVERGHRQRTYQ